MQGKPPVASPPAQTIVLSPEKASDFEGELAAVADALTTALTDLAVEIRDPLKSPPGAFLPEAAEVLTAIFPFAAGYAFNRAADLIIGKLRTGSKGDDVESPVRIVKFYGPTGEILKRVRIPTDGSEAEED
jgi:hypothetical protein